MIDIEEELEAIIKDNGLQAFDLLKTRLERIIGDILQNAVIKHGRKIIIRGLKPSEKTIHPFVSLVSQYGEIVSIVDRAPSADQIFYGQGKAAPVLGCNDSLLKSKESQCDIYIINSLYNGKNIYYEEKERLLKKGIYVIDLYTEIRRTYSVCLGKEYEYYTVERDFTHNRLQEAISDFRADPNENTLTRLLSICLSMRDFVSFYTYMKEGIKFLGQSAFLVKIHRDINRLLQKIQEEIESRNKLCHSRDIILHWIDQVGYDELRLLPKVSAHIHQGLIFLNSYTVTPYTKPTVRMIFWKDFRIKEKSDENNGGGGCYERRIISDSPVYKKITESGYRFETYGYIEKILFQEKDGSEYCETSIAASVHYWRMLRDLILSNGPFFGIVHVLEETHEPFISPESTMKNMSYGFHKSYKTESEKIERSAAYADCVIDLYTKLLSVHTVNIYMSDHGKWEDTDRRRYKDNSMHTILGITNLGIRGEVERVFSYEHFDVLTDWVLKMAAPQEMFFCDYPIYSSGFRGAIMERGAGDTDICEGYSGVKTDIDQYICLDSGQEYYFTHCDGEHNHIEKTEYLSRIQYLRMRHKEMKERIITAKHAGCDINKC